MEMSEWKICAFEHPFLARVRRGGNAERLAFEIKSRSQGLSSYAPLERARTRLRDEATVVREKVKMRASWLVYFMSS